VAFAAVFTFLIVWVAHGLLYRWPATRVSDAAIERLIERLALPVHAAIATAFARMGSAARRLAQRGGS
jgi:lipid A 4'-phosphatase